MSRKDPHMSGAMGALLDDMHEMPRRKAPVEKPVAKPEKKEPAKPRQDKKEPTAPPVPRSSDKVVELDTTKVAPWPYLNRPLSDMGDMEGLTASIKANKQQVPIMVRPAPHRDDCDYEYYAGHRRYTACSELGIKVLALIRDVDDQDAAAVQELENEERNGISSWGKAQHYKRLLDNKVFPTSSALATHIGVTRATLSDTMSYFRINQKILDAIGDLANVSVFSAKVIASLAESESNHPALIELADRIRAGSLKGNSIKREVALRATNTKRATTQTVKGKAGDLMTVRNDSNGTPVLSLLKSARELCDTDELVEVLRKHLDQKHAAKGVKDE